MKFFLSSFITIVIFSAICQAQVTVTNPLNTTPALAATYTSLANAINALNTITSVSGPVVITLQAAYAETAPAGGYAIEFSAVTSPANNIRITGSNSIITAFTPQVSGSMNDAVFKLIGVDYVTLDEFIIAENALNINSTPGTNDMTEWGVALLRASTSVGAQNNTIQNNSISLNRNYTNTFAVYSNALHAANAVTFFQDITNSTTAPHHGNKVYGNLISNVNMGIAFIGSAIAANMDLGNDIGGTTALTGNTITNWGGAAAATAYVENPASSYGIFMNHQLGDNVSRNTLTSAAVSGSPVSFRGIFKNYSITSPPGAFTSDINYNTITMVNGFATGNFTVIESSGLTGVSTAIISINNNEILNCSITAPGASVTFTGILNSSRPEELNINNNTVRGITSTASSGNFRAIENSGNVVNTVNINGNKIGDAVSGALIYSVATAGNVIGINNSGAASTATVNINNNSVDGISLISSGQVSIIQNSGSTDVAINIDNNQLGSVTGSLVSFDAAQSNILYAINSTQHPVNSLLSISGNDIKGIVNNVGSNGVQQYIAVSATLLSQVGDLIIDGNTFIDLSVNTTNSIYFVSRNGNMSASGYYQCSNNSIVGSFRNNAAVAGTMYFYYTTFLNSQSVNGSSVIVTGNDFSNVIVNGATPIWGWHDLDGVSVFNAPSKTYTNNTISNISSGTGTIVGMYMTNSGQIACSTNVVSNITTGGNMVGIWHGSTNGQGVHYISSNSINNLNSSTGNVVGIMAGASNVPALHISDNNINALSSAAVNGQIVGIEIIQGPLININDNVINNVQGSGTGNPFAYGIRVNTGTLVNVFRNKIYDIRQTANLLTAIPGVIGIHSLNPTNLNIYNNFLSDLKAPNSGQADAIRGININALSINTSYNLYYNSIYINAASTGTNFGSSGIYHTGNATATTGRLEMIDNIIVNTSTANGTGVSTAYRRSNATLTNYSAASDYNLFYAGTPSANSLIYYDGTNADQTLAAYQARVAARDANAVSLLPVFVSATDLHLVPGSNCAIDGRGTPVGGIFTDIDNDTRDAITPDIGADEFTAVYAPTLAGIVGIGVCENKNVSPTGTTYATAICERIAYILPSGAVPLTGTVNACVTLDASQQYFNGEPYVQRHYDIDPATNAATATATITLYFTDAEFVTYNTNNPVWPTLPTMAGGGNADPNRANVKITQFHGTATTSPSSPGNYTGLRVLIVPALPDINWNGTYWEITFNVTGFSGFYVHTNSFGTPLPITINYLKGYKQGNAHLLNWKVTCNSTASATMILERRADGGNFTAINSITADATRCRQPFDYTDTDPLNGMNYYRLKITDSDGKITYSTTVALLNAVKGYGIISLAPNPVVDDRFTLNISSAISSKIDLIIIDVSGRLIKKQMVNLIAGFNAVPVEVGKLAAGTYYVYGIAGGEKSKPVRFVIR